MFAPYCPTCAGRVLMTTRRIVRFTSAETGLVDVVLRCYCGTEVAADANPPQDAPLATSPQAQDVPSPRVLAGSTAAAAS
jgi:hypothetical protein